MEIIKLGDLFELIPGTTKLPKHYQNNGKYNFISYREIFKKQIIKEPKDFISILENVNYSKNTANKGDLLITATSEIKDEIGAISLFWSNNKAIVNGFSKIMRIKDKKIINPKYAFYYLNSISMMKKISNCSNGITRYNMIWNLFKKIKINLPPLEHQQQIIDIIEPFEKANIFFSSINKIIKNCYLLIINNFFKVENKMVEKDIIFIKGSNFSKEIISPNKTNIPFINISAMNDKVNSYIKEECFNLKNIFVGDVILSLDGTPGIVNNLLEGFNGYAYKIVSNKIKNYHIYFSLLTNLNQNIIKINSIGTTIKHSSRSKDKLLLLSFGIFEKTLELIYFYEIKIKIIIKKIKSIILNLQKIFVE